MFLIKMLLGIIPNIIGKIADAKRNKRELANAIAVKKLEIVQTKETADIEWEKVMAEATKGSWKDEFWTIIFGFLLLSPLWDPEMSTKVFENYAAAPEWFQLCVLVAVGASFGVKIWKGFKG